MYTQTKYVKVCVTNLIYAKYQALKFYVKYRFFNYYYYYFYFYFQIMRVLITLLHAEKYPQSTPQIFLQNRVLLYDTK